MKHWLSVGIAVALACAPVRGVAAQNLLANGGFEELGDDGRPAGWSFTGWLRMPMGAARLTRPAHSGQAALALASSVSLVDSLAFSDCFKLDTRELLVTFYYHTRRTPRATVALATFHEEFRDKQWRTPPVQLEFRALESAKPWRLMSCHFPVSPAAQYGVLLFRLRGRGAAMVDDVSVLPYPNKLEAELLVPGLLERLPKQRLVRARVRNLTGLALEAIAELTATAQKAKTVTRSMPFELAPSAESVVSITYPFDAKRDHKATLTLFEADRQQVFEQIAFDAPALVQVQPSSPPSVAASFPRCAPRRVAQCATSMLWSHWPSESS